MSRGCTHGALPEELRGSAEDAMAADNRIFISNRQDDHVGRRLQEPEKFCLFDHRV